MIMESVNLSLNKKLNERNDIHDYELIKEHCSIGEKNIENYPFLNFEKTLFYITMRCWMGQAIFI